MADYNQNTPPAINVNVSGPPPPPQGAPTNPSNYVDYFC